MKIVESMMCPLCIEKGSAPYEAPYAVSKHVYKTLSKSLEREAHVEHILYLGLRRPRVWRISGNPAETQNIPASYEGRTDRSNVRKYGYIQPGTLWNPSQLMKSHVDPVCEGRALIEYTESDNRETITVNPIIGDLANPFILHQSEPFSREYTFKPAGESTVKFTMPTQFTKFTKSANGFYIHGYASPKLLDKHGREVPDLDGDSMDLNGLDEAFRRMMSIHSRRNLMGYHSNIQIGEIVWNNIDSDGVTWKSHVVFTPSEQYPKKGLYVVAEVFDDLAVAKRYRSAMERDHMLSLSISGEALKKQEICSGGVCRNHILKMDLAEISSCEIGINLGASATIMKTSEAARMLASAGDGASLLKLLAE